ncbi:MAG TPA: thiamine phosphate synthase [Nitrolancea sp.]|nr:thiamine phosphate synthase [Nitrolancea sp.]
MNDVRATRDRLRANLNLYVLTDRQLARGRGESEVVEAAIAGGATAIQLRWKTGSMREALIVGRELKQICARSGVLFVVNDRIDLALALDADGVHLGDEDLPLPEARKIVGERMLIGYSPPTLAEAIEAERLGADYLGIGPVYGTSTKADAGAAVGIERIAAVSRAVSIPIVGIGGITAANAAPVVLAGAAGVAVISSIVAADDVREAARQLRDALGFAETHSV